MDPRRLAPGVRVAPFSKDEDAKSLAGARTRETETPASEWTRPETTLRLNATSVPKRVTGKLEGPETPETAGEARMPGEAIATFPAGIQPIRLRLERGDEGSAVRRRLSQKRAIATPRGAMRVSARKRTQGTLSPRVAARMAVPPAAATAMTAIATSREAMESFSRGDWGGEEGIIKARLGCWYEGKGRDTRTDRIESLNSSRRSADVQPSSVCHSQIVGIDERVGRLSSRRR